MEDGAARKRKEPPHHKGPTAVDIDKLLHNVEGSGDSSEKKNKHENGGVSHARHDGHTKRRRNVADRQKSKTALIVVDVQHDFVEGSMAVPNADEIVPLINEARDLFDLVRTFVNCGLFVDYDDLFALVTFIGCVFQRLAPSGPLFLQIGRGALSRAVPPAIRASDKH